MKDSVRIQMNEWGRDKIPFVFLIDFECLQPLCWPLTETIDALEYNFNGFTNIANAAKINSEASLHFEFIKSPISLATYKQSFDFVKNQIEYGNSFLVNLTAPTQIQTAIDIDFIAKNANSKYVCHLKNQFVSFSPETFVQIKDGKIYSYPMKGTIDASIPNAEAIIMSDMKEIAEHATIVDLIRNDLSKVAQKVSVNKYRYYEEIKTNNGILGQVSSEIVGMLPVNYKEKIGDILFDLLPAGSISGAPKNKTVDIIKKAESDARGYYTGVAGYFDGNELDSCVLIRFLQADHIYRSGGGITAKSDLLTEYQELINKVYVPAF